MRRVIPLELVGNESLDFDLYDESGQVIYKKGEKLTPDFLMMINFKKVFKQDGAANQIITPVKAEVPKPEFKSAISEAATETLIRSSKKVLEVVFENGNADVKECVRSRDIIVDEVASKIEKIKCIGQLRVFDEYTFSHIINVSAMSTALGMLLKLDEQEIKDLALGALLHDIGKMKIPKEILNKPGKLDPQEFRVMQGHSYLGYRYIRREMGLSEKIAKIALQHQERYGGGGYPYGLRGENISELAQIVGIIDVYDALISTRAYKPAILSRDAIKIMLDEGSMSFNPYMLSKFVCLANYKDKNPGNGDDI